MKTAKLSSPVLTSVALALVAVLGPMSTSGAQKPKAAAEASAKRSVTADKQAKAATTEAQRAEDRAEKAAKKELKDQPKSLLKGIKLSAAEKRAEKDVEKKYDTQLKALDKEADQARKAHQPLSDVTQRIVALRDQERTDLRAALVAAHQSQLDDNVARVGRKR